MLQIPPNQCQGYTIRHLFEKAPVGGTTVELFRMTDHTVWVYRRYTFAVDEACGCCLLDAENGWDSNLFYQSGSLVCLGPFCQWTYCSGSTRSPTFVSSDCAVTSIILYSILLYYILYYTISIVLLAIFPGSAAGAAALKSGRRPRARVLAGGLRW